MWMGSHKIDGLFYTMWYICQLQLGWQPVAVVQYTFTHKHPVAVVQYTFTHKHPMAVVQYTFTHKHTVAVVQYTFTHKQYIEQHS
jgi:hypothetical protein